MRFKNYGLWGLAFLLLFSFNACSNSSSSDSSDSGSEYETGVFLDSPVISIGYRTDTLEGITNSSGEYDYVEGETVTFFIGNLAFPPVTASRTVTPLDLAGTNDTENNVVVNIIRLLQTLDQDGDPTNGITITSAAKAAATEVDFDVNTTEFEADTEVLALIASGGQDTAVTELVSEDEAITHFEDTLDAIESDPNALTGAWVASTNDAPLALLLGVLDDDNYVGAQQTLGEEGVIGGVEWGTYTLSSDGTVFSNATPVINSNAGDTVVGATITVNSDEETATVNTEEGGEITFSKITSTDAHPEAGLWTADGDAGDSDEEDLNILILDGNGNYMYVGLKYSSSGFNTIPNEGIVHNATEYGTYAISGDFSTITMTPAAATDTSAVCSDSDDSGCDTVAGDTNEGAGFSDIYTNVIPLTLSGNTMTLEITEYADDDVSEGESYTVSLTRIQ